VWRTTSRESFARIAEIKPTGGEFSLRLDPDAIYSLTTTGGQQKGGFAAPPDAGFPLPYADDFSCYRPGATPRYFSDWFGVFAIAGAEGKPCLTQMVPARGIAWGFVKNGDPRSFIGGDNWRDYRVSVEADPNGAGSVSLYGRMSKIAMSNLPGAGYELRLLSSGEWLLLAGARRLEGGRAAARDGWRRLGLEFAGDRVRAFIDGGEAASCVSPHSSRGLAGIGCGLGPGRFRDFKVG
jgi:galactosylceramidase